MAIKAYELAPGRFTWRKYPQQINIENITAFLRDAKKPKNGSHLVGSSKEGWMLTENGLKLAQARIADIEGEDLTRSRLNDKEKQWLLNERGRMLTTDAFLKFQAEGISAVTVQEAAAFFRIDDYVTHRARERKINRIINGFGDDPELKQAIMELARKVREG